MTVRTNRGLCCESRQRSHRQDQHIGLSQVAGLTCRVGAVPGLAPNQLQLLLRPAGSERLRHVNRYQDLRQEAVVSEMPAARAQRKLCCRQLLQEG